MGTLYTVLFKFSKVAAPIIPFITEAIYQSLKAPGEALSVHLVDYPQVDEKLLKKHSDMLEKMASDREVVSKILALRDSVGLGIRQPLDSLGTTSPVNYPDIIRSEVNVKGINVVSFSRDFPDSYITDEQNTVVLNTELTSELKLEGALRNVIRNIQKARKKAGMGLSDKAKVTIPDTDTNVELLEKYSMEISEAVGAVELSLGPDYVVEKI